MIDEKSAFNNIPVVLDSRDVFLLEGIKYSFLNIDFSYKQLYEKLKLHSEVGKSDGLFVYIWSFLDNISRLLKLLDKYKGKKVSEGIFPYEYDLTRVDFFRNTFQHLEDRIIKNGVKDEKNPLYGILYWYYLENESEKSLFATYSGPIRPGLEFQLHEPIGKSILFFNRIGAVLFDSYIYENNILKLERINIDSLHQNVIKIYSKLNENLLKQNTDEIISYGTYGQDFTIQLTMHESNNILS